MNLIPSVEELLRNTRLEVLDGSYSLVRVSHHDWAHLLENPELSPSANTPFMIFRDQYEVSLLLEDSDWRRMRHGARDAKVESDFRLLTLDLELPWNVVGYLARVTEVLAAAGISVGALTAFSRDHLLIKQADLAKALRVLGEHVAESC